MRTFSTIVERLPDVVGRLSNAVERFADVWWKDFSPIVEGFPWREVVSPAEKELPGIVQEFPGIVQEFPGIAQGFPGIVQEFPGNAERFPNMGKIACLSVCVTKWMRAREIPRIARRFSTGNAVHPQEQIPEGMKGASASRRMRTRCTQRHPTRAPRRVPVAHAAQRSAAVDGGAAAGATLAEGGLL